MSSIKFRCSSLGKIMTEPKTQKEGPLSLGAKAYIRTLLAQDIYGVDFEISSKAIEKGLAVEEQSIALLNRVRGLSLAKNEERREAHGLTGECDLYDEQRRRGHDLKSSWSLATFPISSKDAEDRLYEWQMRGYMILWDADEWEVNYTIVDTPEDLVRYEPLQLHIVSHIPEHHRLTTWLVKRDRALEDTIIERLKYAAAYYVEAADEFDRTHQELGIKPADVPVAAAPAVAQIAAAGGPKMRSALASLLD